MDQRITVHCQPNWPHQGQLVIESMAASMTYRSQFETGISSGGLTAYPGGDRWRWESRLFAGRYDDAPASQRPIYGAWNRHGDPYGGAIRFGSAHFRLRPEVTERATFCFPDSSLQPDAVVDSTGLQRLCTMADESDHDELDDGVEAHVHGGVRFADDVEALVLDPCFIGTPVHAAARLLGCPIEFHPGFRVSADQIDPDYRGPHIVEVARALDNPLTPAVIGAAAVAGHYPPQQLKQVWHCLAKFGRLTAPDRS